MDAKGLAALSFGGGKARLLDRVRGRRHDPRARIEGLAVAQAIADWPGVPDPATLQRLLGDAPRYLSVGHSGLEARCLGAMAGLPNARTGVFVHDTIPLDWPETQRAGSTERFSEKLDWVAKSASKVFAPLRSTAKDLAPHLKQRGWHGEIEVAAPGVDVSQPGHMPVGLPMDRPYFVALGTIEPRKNITFLLDLWETLPKPRPRLFVVGRRGWCSEDVFERLDHLSAVGDVIELSGLEDAVVSAVISRARALLFPSIAEGFGYPPVEAVALGTPVVSHPLEQTKELLGDRIIYASVNEMYQWRNAIERMSAEPKVSPNTGRLPKWFVHFDLVLGSLI